MSAQKDKAEGKGEMAAQALGAQISVTSRTDEITGVVVGVELDELIEGQQVSVAQDAGLVSGTLVGAKIGVLDGQQVSVAQDVGLVSGTLVGAKIGVPDGQATTDKPRRGLAKLLARILRRP